MPQRRANEAQFFFFLGGMEPQTFEVADFSGVDRISAPYQFKLTLISKDYEIDLRDALGKKGSLYIYRDGEYFPYSGIVTGFRFVDHSTDHTTYALQLAPHLWTLGLNHQSRVFQRMTVPDIVQEVIDEGGLADFCELDVDSGNYEEHEYVVQYQESDLNFISRLMETNGIWYFFRETPLLAEELNGEPGSEQVVITDKPANFAYVNTSSEIIYRSHSGMHERIEKAERESIHSISRDRRLIAGNAFVKNYNYRTPEVDISSGTEIDGGRGWRVYEYGGQFKNTTAAQRAATVLANRHAADADIVRGTGNCRGFRAGDRFTLREHVRADMNTNYLLTEVSHSGSQFRSGSDESPYSYANRFACIPASQGNSYVPPRRAVTPRITGVMSALIEASGGEYPALDDRGRYKVRLPFDVSDAEKGQASKYVRMASPYSDQQGGFHFPSREGVEMLLGCIDGDPNKPVGLGTVPNANTIPPVVGANKEQHVIHTHKGNEIVLDDADGKQKIRLKTNAGNIAQLDDESKCVYLQTSEQKNKLHLDDQNERGELKSGDNSIVMSYKGGEEGLTITTAGGHVIKLDDAGKKLTIQTNGGHIIQMDDSGKTISLEDSAGKNTVTLDGNKGLVLDSKGKISINASQDLEIKAANIKMQASTGKIEAKATQDMNLSGMKIIGKANTDVKFEGLNVGLKGTVGAKLEGLNTEVKGQVQTKVSGTIAEVSGNAVTNVKGGVVMIN